MTIIVSQISLAQAATIINTAIIFVQLTFSLSLAILLIYFLPKSASALSWSAINRNLHSTLWPSILHADSNPNRGVGATVSTISRLLMLSTILIAVIGVTLPLGLHDGPLTPSDHQEVLARYLPDTSALAMATTPNRSSFKYGRRCGYLEPIPCPGNGDSETDTSIAPSIVEIFNSTRHGPFNMQFRAFITEAENDTLPDISIGFLGTLQSFILRDEMFAIDGVILDMNSSHPGIGFWNQSVPVTTRRGGTWSKDILWLEPVTKCISTNLPVDYVLQNGLQITPNEAFNITDHGGLVNLPSSPPAIDHDGQHIDLAEHAYVGGFYLNSFAMRFLNTTRESSFDGKSYFLNSTTLELPSDLFLGKTSSFQLNILSDDLDAVVNASIESVKFSGGDDVNVTNAHVSCGIFLGPPLRTDNGDPRTFERGSRWTQSFHSCCSSTRAKIERITFSTTSNPSLADIRVSREPVNNTVLWAMEKTGMKIRDFEALWGRVDDKYEDSPSLWTVRSDYFYLPAGAASIIGGLSVGNPSIAHAAAWSSIYSLPSDSLVDYSGETEYAMKVKFDNLIAKSGPEGQAQVRNLIWTDIMVNNVIAGQESDSTLLVAEFQTTIDYNFKYAIPGFLLLLIWAPAFLTALFLLITRILRFEYMRKVLNHTSIGRIVVGASELRIIEPHSTTGGMTTPQTTNSTPNAPSISMGRNMPGQKNDWANTTGRTQVTLDLRKTNGYRENGI